MFERICSWENLRLAYRRASRGKRRRPDVAAFDYRLEAHLLRLQAELRAGAWRPGGYVRCAIHEPKRRIISAAPFRDLVVHHARCSVTEPLFERSFVADSFANRVGKSTHRALARAQALARRFPYVLQCDVREYFPTIDHVVLRGILARKIDDRRVVGLVDRALQSGGRADSRPRKFVTGSPRNWGQLPIPAEDDRGSCCGLPEELEAVPNSRRYGSAGSPGHAGVARSVPRVLRLTVHAGWHPRPVAEGVPFFGFVVYPTRRRLKRRSGVHFRRRRRALAEAFVAGRIGLDRVTASVCGCVNHARYRNTTGLRRAVLDRPLLEG